MGYDRAITVFSPEGRLYQVEYATEAVRHGPLAVGVKATNGVILVGEKRSPHPMADLDSLKKILLIDEHVGTAIAGLHADARKLIDQARVQAQINRLSYHEPISISSLIVIPSFFTIRSFVFIIERTIIPKNIIINRIINGPPSNIN